MQLIVFLITHLIYISSNARQVFLEIPIGRVSDHNVLSYRWSLRSGIGRNKEVSRFCTDMNTSDVD